MCCCSLWTMGSWAFASSADEIPKDTGPVCSTEISGSTSVTVQKSLAFTARHLGRQVLLWTLSAAHGEFGKHISNSQIMILLQCQAWSVDRAEGDAGELAGEKEKGLWQVPLPATEVLFFISLLHSKWNHSNATLQIPGRGHPSPCFWPNKGYPLHHGRWISLRVWKELFQRLIGSHSAPEWRSQAKALIPAALAQLL